MRTLTETIAGLWALLVLGFKTKFSLRGPYWRWRTETAFGTDPSKWPSLTQRIRAILEYGRWVHRMKRRL